MNTVELEMDNVRNTVRERYGKIAEGTAASCCSGSCCSGDRNDLATELGYSQNDTASAPEGANLGLGCGNPTAIAALQRGQIVLDLGSGAGFDVFLAAQAVGPNGRVIGVDMTPAMISKARSNKAKGDYANVEFRLGEIEHLPVADKSADVILSNCVINLSPDKPQVFREAYRVLKPGGLLAIADIVARRQIPDQLRQNAELYTGCIAGAIEVEDLERVLRKAGFERVRVDLSELPSSVTGTDSASELPSLETMVGSATITAFKPAE